MRVDRWLAQAGQASDVRRAKIAIDLVDGLYASAVISKELSAMLRCDPRSPAGRDRAASHAVRLGVYARDELRYHIQRLSRHWESSVEDLLARRPRRRPRTTAG